MFATNLYNVAFVSNTLINNEFNENISHCESFQIPMFYISSEIALKRKFPYLYEYNLSLMLPWPSVTSSCVQKL